MAHNILYAEDDPNDIALAQVILQSRADLNLQFVRDGTEALSYLKGRNHFADRRVYPVPHVVLLDIKMPRMSGLDVLAWMHGHPPYDTTPVVILSSSDAHSDIARAYQNGANAYLVKPSAFHRLQAALVQTIDRCLAHPTKPRSVAQMTETNRLPGRGQNSRNG